jgi:hypothetical protein
MHWLSRLEKKFGHWAIHGLLRYVAALSSLCFILAKVQQNYLDFLWLDWNRVMQGEVWRLITYIFIPTIGGVFPDFLGMALYVMFMFWVGDGLDRAWGAFRFNVFFLLGMIGTTLAAFISRGDPSGGYLQMTVFLAFARFYPDEWIRLFFLLPVKVKWLAWLDGALLCLSFIQGTTNIRLAIIAGLANYFIFFGRDIIADIKMHREIADRRSKFQREVREGREETLHRCKVCGLTEVQSPHAEFRVASDGDEYCIEHLPKRAAS